jgi:hypothetical protein
MNVNEKEALLIMFGPLWQKKYWSLDGQKGRPSISECIDCALKSQKAGAQKDLVSFLENYLSTMARRCDLSARKDYEKFPLLHGD